MLKININSNISGDDNRIKFGIERIGKREMYFLWQTL